MSCCRAIVVPDELTVFSPPPAAASALAEAEPSFVSRPAQRTDSGTVTTTTRASKTSGDGWLVFPRPKPDARMRLFCFPFAGAGAAPFRPWADLLDDSIELVAIEPPGHGTRVRERPAKQLEPYLKALLRAMSPYLDKPCAFFGNCLGGLIAFEAGRRLLGNGAVRLAHLFAVGTRPPHLLNAFGRFEEGLLLYLLRLPDYDPFRPAHEQPEAIFAEYIRRFNIDATQEMLSNAELKRLLLPGIRADFSIAYGYKFAPEKPWEIPITCFHGVDDPYVTRDDALAWSQYTRVAFNLILRDGAHYLIVEDREFIVASINRELSRWQ